MREPDDIQRPDASQRAADDLRTVDTQQPDADSFGPSFANRPLGYPSALVWLRAGVLRDWRGVLGSFLATWFYVPVALLLAVLGGLVFAMAGLVGGAQVYDQLPEALRDSPLAGPLLDAFLSRSGGVLGGFAGFAVGFLAGFLIVLVWPWRDAFDEPANLLTGLAGMIVAAALVGVLYTLYRVLLEPRLLVVSGARPLSRREAERLRPILYDCARRLGLPNVPRLLIDDNPVLVNARAYARHVVVSTGLLERPDEEIAALLSHELVHWRTGDEVTSAFVRGVGLPLVLLHAVPTWLMRRFPHPATDLVVFLVFWPVLLTMKYLVLPLHRRDVRAAEYRADAGAVLAGHVEGLRNMLEQRKSFENGRSGWDEAVCATHPPSELRLDRLERLAPGSGAAAGPDDQTTAPQLTAEDVFGPPGPIGTPKGWLVAGVLLLVCGLGTGVLSVAQWALFRPQAVVDDYFSALDDRDAQAALEQLEPDARSAVGDGKPLAELLRAKGYRPPTDIQVTSIERDGDEATAAVSFTVDGQKVPGTLSLRRDESAALGLFHRWRITNGLATLTLPGRAGLTVNGVAVEGASEGRVTLALLPGAYTVGGQRNPLVETPARTVLVGAGQDSVGPPDLTPTLAAGAQELADQEVRRYLDACAAQKVALPEGCPFGYYTGYTVKSISWKIIEYPQVRLTPNDDGTVSVATPPDARGTARATGTTTGYFGTSPLNVDDTFVVNGVLAVVDGKPTFQLAG